MKIFYNSNNWIHVDAYSDYIIYTTCKSRKAIVRRIRRLLLREWINNDRYDLLRELESFELHSKANRIKFIFISKLEMQKFK